MSVSFASPVVSIPLPNLASASGPYVPAEDSVAVGIFLDGVRKARLKEKYGWGTGLPKLPRRTCPVEQLARADALRKVGLEKRADRAEICNRVGELWECPECGDVYKRPWGCALRSCPFCAKKIFDHAFSELLPVESQVPPALASLPGWGWKILDFTFSHDGDFATRDEMRTMRRVVNRVVGRALRENCREMMQARKGCRLRFHDSGEPMVSYDAWPLVSTPDGSARALVGWTVVRPGRIQKRPTCVLCDSRVKKIKGEHARHCPKCGPVLWPDWEDREVDTRRWKLRFGFLHIAVSEFGYSKETGGPNFNYHFHGCFFGPYLENRPTCARCGEFVRRIAKDERGWNCPNCGVVFEVTDGRVVQIFREESKKALEVESRGVLILPAKRGYRSALGHALKYTEKLPATTPEGLAAYEKALVGVRRYALRGFLQGVALEDRKPAAPKCPKCKVDTRRVSGLGVIPLSEIEDIPFLPEEESECKDARLDDDFYEPGEIAPDAPRAPC